MALRYLQITLFVRPYVSTFGMANFQVKCTKLFAALTIISDKCAYGNRAEHGIEGPCLRCHRTGNEDVRRSEGMQKKKWQNAPASKNSNYKNRSNSFTNSPLSL